MSLVGLLQAAAVLTVLFSLLSGLGISNHLIELLAHFRLQYLAASVLLLIAFAVLRSPVYASVLLATALFNAGFVLSWYFGDARTNSGARLKLLHANVRSSNSDYERFVRFVESEKPDLVFLQEITQHWVQGTQELLKIYPYTYAEPRSGNFGIAMYSKIPLDSVRHVDSPPLGYPTIVATLTVSDETLTVISSHPTIPLGRDLYNARNEQLADLARIVGQANGHVVLLGDFNATLWDRGLRELEASSGIKNVRRGFGILPSWPTFLPFAMIPIDHAFVSDEIGVVDARVGRRIGSDHLPLIVTLAL